MNIPSRISRFLMTALAVFALVAQPAIAALPADAQSDENRAPSGVLYSDWVDYGGSALAESSATSVGEDGLADSAALSAESDEGYGSMMFIIFGLAAAAAVINSLRNND